MHKTKQTHFIKYFILHLTQYSESTSTRFLSSPIAIQKHDAIKHELGFGRSTQTLDNSHTKQNEISQKKESTPTTKMSDHSFIILMAIFIIAIITCNYYSALYSSLIIGTVALICAWGQFISR